MEKQFKDLLKLYREYIEIFNNWQFTKDEKKDNYNWTYLVRILYNLTDILVDNNIIERYGIKHYKIVETGEII